MIDEVEKYINKQKSPQKEICRELRKIILKTSPDIKEEMRVSVSCYGHTKKNICGNYYIASLRDHVNYRSIAR